ncbi:fatty acid desaturase [Leptospira fluminis]|uniref:Fatty acid desaturase n=1 Tax=Leptospira fluminis TaxID=2484979 RepID=A0A4R9GLP3_9LEPT|nr:fatty acid desaturase [Leptospira fluminis]TGK15673.1 fatty acid desaturase [Leptospira fluminis]
METKKKQLGIIRHRADLRPFFWVLGVGSLQFCAFYFCDSVESAIYSALALFIPQALVGPISHNHAHYSMLKPKWMNKVLEVLMYLESGQMASKFRLHHNFGHHLHYTDPKKDTSTWVRSNGSSMNRLEYIFMYFATYTYRTVQVGKSHPALLRQFYWQQFFATAAIGILVYLNPLNALILYLVPMLLSWLVFINFTYDNHIDLHSKDDYEASMTNTNPLINFMIFNNGYHLAHHIKQGLHWSELPEFHKSIEHRIPEHLRPVIVR